MDDAESRSVARPLVERRTNEEARESRLAKLTRLELYRVAGLIGEPTPRLVCLVELLDGANPPAASLHPLCQSYAEAGACRQMWRTRLDRKQNFREPDYSRCPYGNWCSLTPIVQRGGVLACCMVADPGTGEDEFRRRARLLVAGIDAYLAPGVRLLDGMLGGPHANPASEVHPKLWNAIMYIHRHLADSTLSVQGVASALGLNSTYLAHLFVIRFGTRMRHYISERRIHLASFLLAAGGRQVKQVASDSGHANTDWFSHVFHRSTGLSPSDYQRNTPVSGLSRGARPPMVTC